MAESWSYAHAILKSIPFQFFPPHTRKRNTSAARPGKAARRRSDSPVYQRLRIVLSADFSVYQMSPQRWRSHRRIINPIAIDVNTSPCSLITSCWMCVTPCHGRWGRTSLPADIKDTFEIKERIELPLNMWSSFYMRSLKTLWFQAVAAAATACRRRISAGRCRPACAAAPSAGHRTVYRWWK